MRLLFEEVLMKFINVDVICVPVSQRQRQQGQKPSVGGGGKMTLPFRNMDFCRLCLYEASRGIQPVQVLSKQHSLSRSADKMKTSVVFHFILARDCIPLPTPPGNLIYRPTTWSTYKQSSFEIRVEIQPLSGLLGSSVDRVLQVSLRSLLPSRVPNWLH